MIERRIRLTGLTEAEEALLADCAQRWQEQSSLSCIFQPLETFW